MDRIATASADFAVNRATREDVADIATLLADRGVVMTQWVASNQKGEVVCTVKGMGMYKRRPA